VGFGEAFYGRSAAYELAMTDGREALAQAIRRNILNGRDNADDFENPRRLATYANTAIAALLLETTPRC
jgi:cytochrome b pre-mRNA-processing protein 3